MEERFRISADIHFIQGKNPIRMAHHKTMDKPENHVLHINNYVEIYVYIAGNHQYIVENSVYELRRGDVIIINPLEVHKALPLASGVYERFYFLIDSKAFEGMWSDPLSAILNKPIGSGNLISFDEEKREAFLEILYAISNCFRDGRDDQLCAAGYFLQMMSEINQYVTGDRLTVGNVAGTPRLLESVLSYIAEHTANIETITEIASALGVTPQYLSGYFSKHIGTPLKTYIQAKKIALSKELLDKGADVTEACYECGFNDCSYFIRVFKKYVGMTPLSYKTGRGTKPRQ